MSGIIGMVNGHAVAADLIEALGRLAAPGSHAMGLAVTGPGFMVRKLIGRTDSLRAEVASVAPRGQAGIGHRGWSEAAGTVPTAHPHVWDGVAVVQNGVIENHIALRAELLATGDHGFLSDSDAEVVPHLIAEARRHGRAPLEALRTVCRQLRGAYALAALFEDLPGHVLVARQGCPLVVADAPGASAIASDPAGLPRECRRYAVLEDGDFAELSGGQVRVLDHRGEVAVRLWQPITAPLPASLAPAGDTRGEIAGQPASLCATLDALEQVALLGFAPGFARNCSRLVLIGSGPSLAACQAVQPWIERLCLLPCEVRAASEYRTNHAPLDRGSMGVLVCQDGEATAMLEASFLLRQLGVPRIAVVGSAGSRLARDANLVWPTPVGREHAPAASKSFTAQLLALLRLAVRLAVLRNSAMPAELAEINAGLELAPAVCAAAEGLELECARIGRRVAASGGALCSGTGWSAALASAAAEMLQRLGGLRTGMQFAGELASGATAMMRPGTPVLLCAEDAATQPQIERAARQLRAAGAWVAILASTELDLPPDSADLVLVTPGEGPAALFGQTVALQLIACHAAGLVG